MSKVSKHKGHWLWTDWLDKHGYGRFYFFGKQMLAHRWAYERWVGPIPDGYGLDHECRTPSCVNPAHVRPATQADNMQNVATRSDNRSGYRGVSWNKRLGKWHARVKHQGVLHHVGYFDDVREAAEAAKSKRLELFTFNAIDQTQLDA